MATLKLSVGPAVEPISSFDVERHSVLSSDDPMIDGYIAAARRMVESYCGPLISQTWIQYDDAWPYTSRLIIRKPRVSAVTSIKYKDYLAVESTFSSSNYFTDLNDAAEPCVFLKTTASWPTSTVLYEVNPIYTEFVCGYGATAASVPDDIKLVLMMLVGYLNENREADFKAMPMGFVDMLSPYRIYGG